MILSKYFLLLQQTAFIYIYMCVYVSSDINNNVFNYSDAQVSSGQDPGDKEAALS